MAAKKKSDVRDQKSEVSKTATGHQPLATLLTEAGFQTLEKRSERILIASGAECFDGSHMAFIRHSAGHPQLIGCSRFEASPSPVLIVHCRPEVRDQGSEVRGQESEKTDAPTTPPDTAPTSEPVTDSSPSTNNYQPSTDEELSAE